MIMTWPPTLPRPERDTWQLTLQDARRKRQSDAGPPAFRRRFSGAAKTVNLSVLLTRGQRQVFDQFFHDHCSEGSRLFYMPDPTTEGWPLLASDGRPLMVSPGVPLLMSGRWLCSWGDQPPGRTREGVDCYGLACVIYAVKLGIALPGYVGSYASADEVAEISALIGEAAQSPSWHAVAGLARPYDLALFRRGRLPGTCSGWAISLRRPLPN